MKSERFKKLAEEYVVHLNVDEVTGDVDGSIKQHNDLLEDDQNCVEKIMKVDSLDSSNTGNCSCDLCCDDEDCISKSSFYLNAKLKNNRILQRLAKNKKR